MLIKSLGGCLVTPWCGSQSILIAGDSRRLDILLQPLGSGWWAPESEGGVADL